MAENENEKVREAIPSQMTFEEAVEMAVRLAQDGHLPEETCDDIMGAIPFEMHIKFGMALNERNIIVDLMPAPSVAEDPIEEDVDPDSECPQGVIAYTQKPKNMTPLQDAAYEVLRNHRGKENAIRVRDLEYKIGLPPSDAYNRQSRVRGIVKQLVERHCVPIGSANPDGYYLIRTMGEMDETCRMLLKPAISMIRRMARLKGVAPHILIKQLVMAELEKG